jgi:hypothetical protein
MLVKEFVPYKQALALKELGFDEPCFANYTVIPEDEIDWFTIPEQGITDKTSFGSSKNYNSKSFEEEGTISAPTFSQAFRWFRETYNIDAWVQPFVAQSKKNIPYLPDESYGYFIFKDGVFVCDKVDLLGPEEAELACLIELIGIVKEKK